MERINNFCDSVLGCIPRATRREKADIRDELLDHLLEHKDVLMGYGLEEAEAEKRAVEAMGDAEGIGKAWNEKLSPVWLWLGRVLALLLVCLCLNLAIPFVDWADGVVSNLYARTAEQPEGRSSADERYTVFRTEERDIRQEFGDHIIRLYRTQLSGDAMCEGVYYLHVDLVTYPSNPLHYPMEHEVLMHNIRCDGREAHGGSGGGGSGPGYSNWSAAFEIPFRQEKACITVEHEGNRFEVELPLNWKGESP